MGSLVGRYVRTFSAQSPQLEKPLPPRIVIPEKDIIESFLKGTGPGGQKINKTSSAVQLKHIPTGIVVKNQATRSRDQNRKNARRILGEKLEELEQTPRWAATELKGDKIRKKKASAAKKSRRKYRELDAGATDEAGKDAHTGHNTTSQEPAASNVQPERSDNSGVGSNG